MKIKVNGVEMEGKADDLAEIVKRLGGVPEPTPAYVPWFRPAYPWDQWTYTDRPVLGPSYTVTYTAAGLSGTASFADGVYSAVSS